MTKSLNLDIPKTVAEFESIISQLLPKKIFYKLLLRGKGFDFDGYRFFGNDEDSSFIDWKASIRANTLLSRQYIEEREIKTMIVIDVGDNMIFGSGEKLKCEYSAEISAALAHLLINVGDKVGFTFFGNGFIRTSMPLGGKDQFDILTYNVSDPSLYGGNSNLSDNLDSLLEFLNPSINMVIIISDFINLRKENLRKFITLGNLFETVALIIRDPLDMSLPDIDKELILEDIKTGEKLHINSMVAKKIYEINAEKQMTHLTNFFHNSKIDFVYLNTQDNLIFNLAQFLKRRLEARY